MMFCEEEERVRRPIIFRDRTNPMEFLEERDIVERYRMPRDNIYEIVRLVQDAVESPTMRSHAIPPLLQVGSFTSYAKKRISLYGVHKQFNLILKNLPLFLFIAKKYIQTHKKRGKCALHIIT